MGLRLSRNSPAPEDPPPASPPPASPPLHPVLGAVPERGIRLQRLLADLAFVLLLVTIVVLNVLVFVMECVQKGAELLILFSSYFIQYGLITPLDYCMHVMSSLGGGAVPVALLYAPQQQQTATQQTASQRGTTARLASPSSRKSPVHRLAPPTTGHHTVDPAHPNGSASCHVCRDAAAATAHTVASRSQPILKQKESKVCGSVCFLMDKGKCRETCLT